MSRENAEAVKRIFGEVLEKPADQRAAHLEAACRGDEKLRARVEALLAAHEDAGNLLSAPIQAANGTSVESAPDANMTGTRFPEQSGERPGSVIGRYKLLHLLGEGGMGVVYLAEQTKPVRRRVALKIVKLGMDTKAVVGRFEGERQALALMNHPNVAAVHDAGATETGRPYFVMEYVAGVPITKFCDTHRLTMRERQELFVQVCEAIQHAHQKGIIHRDIKPSNVLVMRRDRHPVPKVIDFGVARATDQRLTEKTVFTEQGVMIGTPAYMSPEQAEMSPLEVDTRTDVYSLGVLLYELLAGALPFEPTELLRAGYAEMQRIIREVEPPKPSTRFSSLGDTSGSISDQRRLDIRAMRRELRGDLDWITMKAIDKDPARRYASASELASDMQRHLHVEPVIAGPPGIAYRVKKLVQKHRRAFAAAVAFVLMLTGSLVVTSGLWARAERALTEAKDSRQVADTARQEEESQRKLAEASAKRAEQEADRARKEAAKATRIQEFLQETLASVDPEEAKGADITVREVLDEAAQRIGSELGDHPAVEAAVRHTIGTTYKNLGRLEQAKEHFEIAVAIRRDPEVADELDLANSLRELGWLEWYTDRDMSRCRSLLREALAIREARLPEDHPLTAEVISDLAELEAAAGNESARWGLSADFVRRLTGKVVSGEELHAELEQKLDNISELWKQGRREDALAAVRSGIQSYTGGEVNTQELMGMLLGGSRLRQAAGDYDAAEPLAREAVRIARDSENPSYILMGLDQLASLLYGRRAYSEAANCYSEALKLRTKIYGDEHSYTLRTRQSLAGTLQHLGEPEEAEAHYRQILDIWKRTGIETDDTTAFAVASCANALVQQAEYEEAERLYRDALKQFRQARGEDDAFVRFFMWRTGDLLERVGKYGEAEEYYRRTVESKRRKPADEGVIRFPLHSVLVQLGQNLLKQGKFVEAEPVLRECLDVRRDTLEEDSWLIYSAMSLLGESLTGLQEFSEAETLLLDASDGLHKNREAIPDVVRADRLTQAVDRVVSLYEAWHAAEPAAGHDAEAAEWRTKQSSLER